MVGRSVCCVDVGAAGSSSAAASGGAADPGEGADAEAAVAGGRTKGGGRDQASGRGYTDAQIRIRTGGYGWAGMDAWIRGIRPPCMNITAPPGLPTPSFK